MKKVLFCLLFLPSMVMAQEVNFMIKGEIDPADTTMKTMNLTYRIGDSILNSSTSVVDGRFQFDGTIPEPVSAMLYPSDKQALDGRTIFLENEPVNVQIKEVTDYPARQEYTIISDGQLNKENNYLASVFRGLYIDEAKLVNNYLNSLSKEERREFSYFENPYIDSVSKSMVSRRYEVMTEYAKEHPNSQAVLARFFHPLNVGAVISPDANKLQDILSLLSPGVLHTDGGRYCVDAVGKMKKLDVGLPAPQFSLPDVEGKEYPLDSFKGKYVLIDFWASWCAACRAQNPFMKRAYEATKDKNIEFVSISLDEYKDNWLRAVDEDELPWLQLVDFRGFNDKSIANLYYMTSIPHNFLINPEGVIIDRDVYNDEILESLKKNVK